MKTILFVVLVLFAFPSFSQLLTRPNPHSPGVVMQYSGADSGVLIGTSNGKPILPPDFVRREQLAVLRWDMLNGKMWVFRPGTCEYDSTVFGGGSVPTMQQTFDASVNDGSNLFGFYQIISRQMWNYDLQLELCYATSKGYSLYFAQQQMQMFPSPETTRGISLDASAAIKLNGTAGIAYSSQSKDRLENFIGERNVFSVMSIWTGCLRSITTTGTGCSAGTVF